MDQQEITTKCIEWSCQWGQWQVRVCEAGTSPGRKVGETREGFSEEAVIPRG